LKKIIFCTALIFCFMLSACAKPQEPEQSYPDPLTKDTINVGVRTDAPGFGYLSIELGEATGYEVDIANAIADALDKKAEFVEVNDETREEMLSSGQVDMIAATYTITDERKEQFNFSRPYYTDWIAVLVPENSKVMSFSELDGARIGTIKGTTPQQQLETVAKEQSVTVEPVMYEDFAQARKALFAGEVDALFMDESIIRSYSDGRVLDERYAPQEYGIATRKSDGEFAGRIDEILGRLDEDGTLEGFRAHWELN